MFEWIMLIAGLYSTFVVSILIARIARKKLAAVEENHDTTIAPEEVVEP